MTSPSKPTGPQSASGVQFIGIAVDVSKDLWVDNPVLHEQIHEQITSAVLRRIGEEGFKALGEVTIREPIWFYYEEIPGEPDEVRIVECEVEQAQFGRIFADALAEKIYATG
jgi:hypothetical protein